MKLWKIACLLWGFSFTFGGGLCLGISNNSLYFLVMVAVGAIILSIATLKD